MKTNNNGSEGSTSSGGRMILDFIKKGVPEEELMELYSHLQGLGLEEAQDPSC